MYWQSTVRKVLPVFQRNARFARSYQAGQADGDGQAFWPDQQIQGGMREVFISLSIDRNVSLRHDLINNSIK